MKKKFQELTLVKSNSSRIGYYLMRRDQPRLCTEQRQALEGVPSARSVIIYYELIVLQPFSLQ